MKKLNCKLVFISILFVHSSDLFCQDLYYYDSGNGYEYENTVARMAFDCIFKGCVSNLKRTDFIDAETRCDYSSINLVIELINSISNRGFLIDRKIFRWNVDIPELTYYRTYHQKNNDSILCQIKIRLKYESGFFKAEGIKVNSDKIIYSPEKSHLEYDYSAVNESVGTNIPYPPPIIFKRGDDYHYGFNLCSGCYRKGLITIDNQRKYWLNNKHIYDRLEILGDGLILSLKDSLYGIIDSDNNKILPIEYDKMEVINNQYLKGFKVFKENKIGVFNFDGKQTLPTIFDDIKYYLVYGERNSLRTIYIVKKDGLYGAFNAQGNEIVPIKYEEINLFYSQYFTVKEGSLYAFMDLNGHLISGFKYLNIEDNSPRHLDIVEVTNKKGKRFKLFISKENGELSIKKIKFK